MNMQGASVPAYSVISRHFMGARPVTSLVHKRDYVYDLGKEAAHQTPRECSTAVAIMARDLR